MQLAMGDKLVTLDDLKAVYDSMDGGGSGGVYIVHKGETGLDKTAGEIIAAARDKLVLLLGYGGDNAFIMEASYLVNIQHDSGNGAYTFNFATGIYSGGSDYFNIEPYSATDTESYPESPK